MIFRGDREVAHGALQEFHLARHSCTSDGVSVKVLASAFRI
jgi:hypothetical protein